MAALSSSIGLSQMLLSTVRLCLFPVGDIAPEETPRLAKRRGTDALSCAAAAPVPMLSRLGFELDADVTYSVSAGRRGEDDVEAEGARREPP